MVCTSEELLGTFAANSGEHGVGDFVRLFWELSEAGVKVALLATWDGLLIETVACHDDRIDPESVAAVAASALRASDSIANGLMRPRVEYVIVELENGGGIILHRVCDGVMAVAQTDTLASLGLLRMKLRRLAPMIASLVGPGQAIDSGIDETPVRFMDSREPTRLLSESSQQIGEGQAAHSQQEPGTVAVEADAVRLQASQVASMNGAPASDATEAGAAIGTVVVPAVAVLANGKSRSRSTERAEVPAAQVAEGRLSSDPLAAAQDAVPSGTSIARTADLCALRDVVTPAESGREAEMLALLVRHDSSPSALGPADVASPRFADQRWSSPEGGREIGSVENLPCAATRTQEILLGGIRLDHTGLVLTATVELIYGDQRTIGTAAGLNAQEKHPFLIAEAAAKAVTELLSPGYGIVLYDIQPVQAARGKELVARVLFVTPTAERPLHGKAPIDGNPSEAAVKTVLNAVDHHVRVLLHRRH